MEPLNSWQLTFSSQAKINHIQFEDTIFDKTHANHANVKYFLPENC